MKLTVFVALFVVLLTSCGTPKQSLNSNLTTSSTSTSKSSADGSSYENAVVITEKTETKGVTAEYQWLKENYPGYKMISQSLQNYKGKPYDILKFTTKDGAVKEIYFDISNFFGKF